MIHTGGTIAMKTNDDGDIADTEQNPLVQLVQTFKDLTIEQVELFNIPSPHMTYRLMWQLSRKINEVADQYDGVVVTHGTDTLEETAYFLDLTVHVKCAVVVTGAMKSTDQIGTDALANIAASLAVARDAKSQNQGVLVVLNDQIFPARYVTKSHTTNLATFQAPMTGPIGMVHQSQVSFLMALNQQRTLDMHQLIDRVYLFKAYAGMDGQLFQLLTPETTDGVVIEGMGAGNLPPQTLPAIQKLIAQNIPVVLVSRCFNGSVAPVYSYIGGGVNLQKMGLLLCHGLNGQKAMVRLVIGLSAGLDHSELGRFMSNDN